VRERFALDRRGRDLLADRGLQVGVGHRADASGP
jgi:hypothetical protein